MLLTSVSGEAVFLTFIQEQEQVIRSYIPRSIVL